VAPGWALYPLVVATCAAVIASQALISGAFSITTQAMRLDYLPRLKVVHTSEEEQGQIYLPGLNWMLLVGVFFLVLEFRSSSALAAAYGISVTATMAITTVLDVKELLPSLIGEHPPTRVPGTAVFMTSNPEGAPPALLQNIKHNKVLHEQVMRSG